MVSRKTVNKKDKFEENEGPLAVYCNSYLSKRKITQRGSNSWSLL